MPRVNGKVSNYVLEPFHHDEWVAMHQAFVKEFGMPESVIYPCCGTDVSPSKVFDEVTYVDAEAGYIDCLLKEDFNAIQTNVEEFKTNELFDLLILLNPTISSFHITDKVKLNGFVMANNYHGNAKELFESPDFEIKCIIKQDASLDKDFNGLFERFESVEEYKEACPEEFAEILPLYKGVLLNTTINLNGLSDIEIYELGLEQLMSDIPFKKGYCDDFYVFQKKPFK